MFRQPAIIMSAALAEPFERGGKAHERHEQYVGDNDFSLCRWLQHAERAGRKIAVAIGVCMAGEGHRRAARGKAGQGDAVSGLVEESRIAAGGCFTWSGMVETDHRIGRNPGKQRRWGAMEQQPADRIRQRFDMRAACSAKGSAKFGFGGHALLQPHIRAPIGPMGPKADRPPAATRPKGV
jgi:hypothetical protein